MGSFDFWRKWLVTEGILLMLFGIYLGVFDYEFRYIDTAFWGSMPVSPEARLFQKWVFSTYGVVLVSFGLSIVFIANFAFKNRETWAWYCLLFTISTLALLDPIIGLYYGLTVSSIFFFCSVPFLLAPLFFTKKRFPKTG